MAVDPAQLNVLNVDGAGSDSSDIEVISVSTKPRGTILPRRRFSKMRNQKQRPGSANPDVDGRQTVSFIDIVDSPSPSTSPSPGNCIHKFVCGHRCKQTGDHIHTDNEALPEGAISTDPPCQEDVETQLPCGHIDRVPCSLQNSDVTCTAICGEMTCEDHYCYLTCGNEHEHKMCQTNVPVMCAICDEMYDVPCYEMRVKQTFYCGLERSGTFPCGHNYKQQCPDKIPEKCLSVCLKMLDCQKHQCSFKCAEDHDHKCNRLIMAKRLCGHSLSRICGETTISLCTEIITERLKCGHDANVQCKDKGKVVKCQESVPFQRSCGHIENVLCGETGEDPKGPCTASIMETLNCGHSVPKSCHDNSLPICPNSKDVSLRCGHVVHNVCDNIKKVNCRSVIEIYLSCGHISRVACGDSKKPASCNQLVRLNSCEHMFVKRCGDPDPVCGGMTSSLRQCGHYVDILCKNLASSPDPVCDVTTVFTHRPCGHTEIGKCGQLDRTACIKCPVVRRSKRANVQNLWSQTTSSPPKKARAGGDDSSNPVTSSASGSDPNASQGATSVAGPASSSSTASMFQPPATFNPFQSTQYSSNPASISAPTLTSSSSQMQPQYTAAYSVNPPSTTGSFITSSQLQAAIHTQRNALSSSGSSLFQAAGLTVPNGFGLGSQGVGSTQTTSTTQAAGPSAGQYAVASGHIGRCRTVRRVPVIPLHPPQAIPPAAYVPTASLVRPATLNQAANPVVSSASSVPVNQNQTGQSTSGAQPGALPRSSIIVSYSSAGLGAKVTGQAAQPVPSVQPVALPPVHAPHKKHLTKTHLAKMNRLKAEIHNLQSRITLVVSGANPIQQQVQDLATDLAALENEINLGCDPPTATMKMNLLLNQIKQVSRHMTLSIAAQIPTSYARSLAAAQAATAAGASGLSLSAASVVQSRITVQSHAHWGANQELLAAAAQQFARVVPRDSAEFKIIQEKIKGYVNFEIESVEKLVNRKALSNYDAAKDDLVDPLHSDLKVYSNSISRLLKIVNDGFSSDDIENGAYGFGICFLDSYVEDSHILQNNCVLLCDVLLGNSFAIDTPQTFSSEVLKAMGYDSIYGQSSAAAVTERFVVFNPHQAYAKYVVYFKSTSLDISRVILQSTTFVDMNDSLQNHYRLVENQIFKSGFRDKLISIEHIRNSFISQKFDRKELEFRAVYGEKTAESKKILSYHGTLARNVDSILRDNFSLSVAGINGQAYGNGVYFSDSPKIALGYARDCCHVIACYILPGKVKEVMGPENDPLYNSYRAEMRGHGNITIIKTVDQILPMFVVTFRNSAALM